LASHVLKKTMSANLNLDYWTTRLQFDLKQRWKMHDLTELTQPHRERWTADEYSQIARGIQPVADHVVRSGRIRAGERVLDLACGTGNTALMARARGARVTGLDLTPELLTIARQRAAEEGYEDMTWKLGNAEELPFADGAFDVVISSCGLMFAPNQAKVATEIARVTRRGGRIAIQAWTPEGGVGRMFSVTAAYVPPPTGAPSPFVWGDNIKVKRLFGSLFEDYRFEWYDCPVYADSPQEIADLFVHGHRPTHFAFHALPTEKAVALRKDLINLYRGYITPKDGKVRWGREYLITLATRT